MGDVTMPFDSKRKSVWSFVPPFFKRGLRLQPVKRAIHLDGVKTFGAKPEPLSLRRIAVETVTPGFVVPPARADVCFAGHAIREFEAQRLYTLVARREPAL